MNGPVLYLSIDGILEPLGYSQIARPLIELGKRGFRYTLISGEQRSALSDHSRCHALREKLASAQIDWRPIEYDRSSSAAANLRNLEVGAAHAAWSTRPSLIHARGYLPATVALGFRPFVRYIFDTRGYWIDEKREAGSWFNRPLAYRAGKALERRLFQHASAVVNLTELASEDVRAGLFGPWERRKPVVTIPTIADYDEFPLVDPRGFPDSLLERFPELRNRLVVSWIGSINASYRLADSLRLFAAIQEREDRAHLLALSGQGDLIREECSRVGIPTERVTATRVDHREMSSFLTGIDVGLLILNETVGKRASMPTKLAEFFATGIRPVQFGCNAEVSQWVERSQYGLVLPSLSDSDLARASDTIVEDWRLGSTQAMAENARAITQPHFGLTAGCDRYERLLKELVS